MTYMVPCRCVNPIFIMSQVSVKNRNHLKTKTPISGALGLMCLLLVLVSRTSLAQTEITIGPETIVPIPDNPVRYFANDAPFPYLPTSNGTANITFWVDGVNYRSEGPSLDSMNPIDPTTSVLSGTPGDFDNGGIWLTSAIRRNGKLYGFYHAEDHSCTNKYVEWNASGLAISTDDGATWSKQGQIIGNPMDCSVASGFGGFGANAFVWDTNGSRWMAWGGAYCFVSTNADALPGTWYGYNNGSFSTPLPGPGSLSELAGFNKYVDGAQSVTWNAYLGRWFMVIPHYGNGATLYYTTSTDGINWDAEQVLFTCATNYTMNYPVIIGESSYNCGQDALLVYERYPGISPGRSRQDMIEQWIHWGPLTIPSTPTNLTATSQYSCQQEKVQLQWNAAPQADSYIIYRATSINGIYTEIAETNTSASFPGHLDTTVAEGTTYYYKVQATNTAGVSAYSSILMVTASAVPAQNAISVNFVGGTSGKTNTLMDCSESAGVVAGQSWNNAVGANGSLMSLDFDSGAASGTTIVWSSPNTWSTGIADVPGNNRMMKGYLDGSNPQATISSIPATYTNSGYDVYVYCDGDASSGRIGQYTIGSITNQVTDNATFNGTFVQASNSAGNYCVFTNLHASSFVLNCQGIGGADGVLRAPLNGLQLVCVATSGSAMPPTILPIYRDGSGNIVIRTDTTLGYKYLLLYTTNLTPPVVWMTNSTTAGTGGTITNTVPLASTPPNRFFRYLVQ